MFLLLAAMLVAGAGVFHPAWPAAAVLASAAWVAWQVRRGTPDDYAVARRADAGLGLKDLLATAWHLRRNKRPSPGVFEPLVEQKASEACRTADVRAAMPFRWNRSATLAAASLCLALAMLAIRIGVLRSFDLRPPLVIVQFDTLTGAPLPPERPRTPPARKLDLPGFQLEETSAGARDEEQLRSEALRSIDSGDSSLPSPQGARRDASRPPSSTARPAPGEDRSEEGDSGGPADNSADAGGRNANDSPPRQQPRDSLLDKMRDALASLMDKLKLEMPPGDGSNASKQGAKQEAARRENGRPQPGKKGEQSGEGDMLSSQQQAAADSSRQAKSEQGGRPDASSQNEKSGIGKEEGRKELQQAEDLQAMGKLDELIGKRAQNVQGEVMVEVTSSKNPLLKTPYADQTAPRGDLGSELGRDEVPLHLQDYVQRYYEQIRRIPPQPRP